MERLPSGKFAVNATFLRLGMLVYNMLRVVGDDLVTARMLGFKNATRRRTKGFLAVSSGYALELMAASE